MKKKKKKKATTTATTTKHYFFEEVPEYTILVIAALCQVLSVLIAFGLTNTCLIISLSSGSHRTLPLTSNTTKTYPIYASEYFLSLLSRFYQGQLVIQKGRSNALLGFSFAVFATKNKIENWF